MKIKVFALRDKQSGYFRIKNNTPRLYIDLTIARRMCTEYSKHYQSEHEIVELELVEKQIAPRYKWQEKQQQEERVYLG